MKAIKEFREFILRGNLVDLAVGIVIGVAFGNVVSALVKDLITPLIGIFGKVSFPNLQFTVNGSPFLIGDFINTLISFLIIAVVVFFLVVKPVNLLMKRMSKPVPPPPADSRECPFCYSNIPMKATRCGFCTSQVGAVAAAVVVAENLQLPKQ